VTQLRAEQRAACASGEAEARAELGKQIGHVHDELAEARGLYRSFYGRKSAGKISAQKRRQERREESDDEVERNLPPELVPVWRSAKRNIKAGKRRSRTEAFLEWVHDNPDDAHAIVYDAIDRDVARMVAEQDAIESRLRKTRGRGYRDEEAQAHALGAGAVPF
jgi:hypothetical protein